MNSDNFKVNLSLRDEISKLDDPTKIHSAGGGATEGMFLKIDWGASKNFTSLHREIFRRDII